MKKVEVIIRPEKLDDMKEILDDFQAGVEKLNHF